MSYPSQHMPLFEVELMITEVAGYSAATPHAAFIVHCSGCGIAEAFNYHEMAMGWALGHWMKRCDVT